MNEPGPNDDAVEELLAAAYAVDGPDANRTLYARWAATYDSGFIVSSGYRYHERVAGVFAERCCDVVGTGEAVVDIGCGTGLAGASLRAHRRIVIDGIDISPEMLRKAAGKLHDAEPVYRCLIEADLTQPLPIDTDAYAGALSVGTFTHGHVGPEALHEVVRIVRPGGRLAIGINAAHFVAAGFSATLDRLVGDRRIRDLDFVDIPIYDGAEAGNPDQFARVATITVT